MSFVHPLIAIQQAQARQLAFIRQQQTHISSGALACKSSQQPSSLVSSSLLDSEAELRSSNASLDSQAHANTSTSKTSKIEASSSPAVLSSKNEAKENNDLEANTKNEKPKSLIEELLDFDTSLKTIKKWFSMKEPPPLVLLGDENYCMALTLTNRLAFKPNRFSLYDWNWKRCIRYNHVNVIDDRVSDVDDYSELLEIWHEYPELKFMILPSQYKRVVIKSVASITLTPFGESQKWDWYRWCKEMQEKNLITIRYWTVEETLKDRARRERRLKRLREIEAKNELEAKNENTN